jgi:pilus assembly protein Flp/PilA
MERRQDETGASAVEYGLLVAGIAGLIVLIVFAFGGVIRDALFTTSCHTIASTAASTSTC